MTTTLIPTASMPVTGADLCDWDAMAKGFAERPERTQFRPYLVLDPVIRERVQDFDRAMFVCTVTLQRGFDAILRQLPAVEDALAQVRVALTARLSDILAYDVVELVTLTAPGPFITLPPIAPKAPPEPEPPAAFTAVREVKDWLGIPQQVVLDAAVISKSTYHSWTGVSTPHASSEGRLWELHLLVASIVEVKGEGPTRIWIKQHPEVLTDLVAGRFHAVASAAFGERGLTPGTASDARAARPSTTPTLNADPSVSWKLAPDDVGELDG